MTVADLALLLGGWGAGWLLLARVPRIDARRGLGRHELPPYAVVIPARDEALQIAAAVHDVLAQVPRPAEVVVVDDASTDGTADAARAAGATVVDGRPLRPGWVGKPWACQQGADATSAPVLVFLDADVRLTPDALEPVVERAWTRDLLLSVAPWHTVRRPYEWLSMLFGIVSFMGVGLGAPLRRQIVGAFGPCIAVRREVYERIGGHAAVAREVVEDLALANRARSSGVQVDAIGGGRAITYRMYPNGARSLVEGWTKNIATGAARTPPLRTLGIGLWVAGLLSAMLAAAGGSALALGILALWLGQIGWMARQTGDFGVVAVLATPALAIVFVAVFARSLVLTALRRDVRWRGRDVPTRAPARASTPIADSC